MRTRSWFLDAYTNNAKISGLLCNPCLILGHEILRGIMNLKSLLCACFHFFLPLIASANPGSIIGPLVDQSRIHLTGVTSFEATQVKRALLNDLEVITIATPSGSRLTYIETLKTRLKAGYMLAGFIDCEVSAQPNFSGDQLTLEVSEGDRYIAGPLVISGLSKAMHTRITKTAQYRSFIKEQWREGQPVTYQIPIPTSYHQIAQQMLSEAGYFKSDLEVVFKPDHAQRKVALHLRVRDLGIEGKLKRVVLKGEGVLEGHHAMILSLLQLNVGQRLDAYILDEAKRRLQQSGRFHLVEYETQPHAQTSAIDVVFNLKVHPALPKLDQKLSAAQEIMLKFAEWSKTLSASRTAIRVSLRQAVESFGLTELELGVSSQEGLIVKLSLNEHERLLIFRPGMIGLYAPDQKQRCVAQELKGTLQLQLKVNLNDDDDLENPMSFQMSAGFSSTQADQLELDAGFAPAASVVSGGRLELHSKSATQARLKSRVDPSAQGTQAWSIDRETGRLIQLTYTQEGVETFKIWSTEDGLSEATVNLKDQGMKNVYDPDRPIWSCLGFALQHFVPLDQLTRDPQRAQEIRGGLPTLLEISKDVIHVLTSEASVEAPQRFMLPASTRSASEMMMSLVLTILQYTQALFETGSWPWTLSRQAMMVIVQRTETLGAELQRISVDPSVGPLGRLAFARALTLVGHQASQFFAQQGLQQLSRSSLTTDLALLYRGSGRIARAGRVFFTSLRGRSEQEIKGLAQLIPSSSRGAVTSSLAALQDPKHDSIEDAIDAMMNVWIDAGLQAWVAAQLQATLRH